MSSGYAAGFELVVEHEKLFKDFKPYQDLVKILEENNVPMECFAKAIHEEDFIYINEEEVIDGPIHQKIDELYKICCDSFEEKYGIGIGLNYHDVENNGDCYDEIDGLYWALSFGDVYQLSDNAKRLRETADFDIKQFVTFC